MCRTTCRYTNPCQFSRPQKRTDERQPAWGTDRRSHHGNRLLWLFKRIIQPCAEELNTAIHGLIKFFHDLPLASNKTPQQKTE